MPHYLDFEKPLEVLEKEIHKLRHSDDNSGIQTLQKRLVEKQKKIYSNLSSYQKVQLARHVDRPYAMDYIKLIMHDYYEIKGDRLFRDDPSIVCFIGYIENQKAIIIGQEKGRGTTMKLKRNFGMPNPEGYRKSLRVAKIAEKFNLPILMLVDTPGAYPGLGAEERGQSEAIAKNLYEFCDLDNITISIVIGEGGSGGALAISVADKLAMMENSVYSVISPEGCSAILYKDSSKVEEATASLKMTAQDLYDFKIIDDLIQEPECGAHRDKGKTAELIKEYFLNNLEELSKIDKDIRKEKRYDKIFQYGSFEEEISKKIIPLEEETTEQENMSEEIKNALHDKSI